MNRFIIPVLLLACHALNGQAITWLNGCVDKTYCLNQGSCAEGDVFIVEDAVTSCVSSQILSYSYIIDLFNNGGVDIQASSDTLNATFPVGTHKITWRASDNCGNVSQCTYLFTIEDCQPPSLLCINSLAQSLDTTCTTTINVEDFILNVSDNCTPDSVLQFGMREVGNGSGFPAGTEIDFTICDLGDHAIEVWVMDEGGLLNKCVGNIEIQDNNNDCDCGLQANVSLQGCVRTGGNVQADHYTVFADVQGNQGAMSFFQTTPDSCYDFPVELPLNYGYQMAVYAGRNDNPLLGVSTFDLLQTTKHILNVEPFQTMYQWLAADVNASGSVTSFDIVETRKLILGIYDTFPKVPSWRFVQPLDTPGNFMSTVRDTYYVSVTQLLADTAITDLDFVGVKMGDANLSASFTGDPDDRAPVSLQCEDVLMEAGEERTLALRWPYDATLSGWQIALGIDGDLAELISVEGVPDDQYYFRDGVLRLLWYDPADRVLSGGEALLRITLRTKQTARVSQLLSLEPGVLRAEAYEPAADGRAGRHALSLRFDTPAGAEIFPPRPNPFSEQTIFEVEMGQAGTVQLDVFDLDGKRVYRQIEEREPGRHVLRLGADHLAAAGVYIYRLQAGDAVLSGRLIRQPGF